MLMKYTKDIIGNRTRDLPVCSAIPVTVFSKDKGIVFPLQARCGPEGGKMYSCTLP